MIDFPYSETAGWFGVILALIGTALSVVFFFVQGLFGFRIMFRKTEPSWHPKIFFMIPVSLFVGLLVAAPAFFTVNRFRALDPDKVSSLHIRGVNDFSGQFVTYSNQAEISNVMRLMRWCRHADPQHDELYGGYTIEAILSEGTSSNLFLDVYRQSTTSPRKTIVARYGTLEAGQFNCQEIQDWVVRVVDPLFKPASPQTVPSSSPNTGPSQRPSQ